MTKFEDRRAKFICPTKTDVEVSGDKIAGYLLRYGVPTIWAASAITLTLAFFMPEPAERAASFQRSGNLLIVIGLFFALWSAWKIQAMERVRGITYDIYFQIEKDKNPHFTEAQAWEIAYLRVDRALPGLINAMQRRLLPHEILVVALGTLIAGYGDILISLFL